MESTPRKSNRKVYLINPSFQIRVISYGVFIATIMTLIFYIANLLFFWKILNIATRLQLAPGHPFFDFIAEQRHYMNTIFTITAVLAVILIAIVGLFWSHRVAGPIHRVQLHMNKIAHEKVFSKLTFRKGDAFVELADSINAALESLHKK